MARGFGAAFHGKCAEALLAGLENRPAAKGRPQRCHLLAGAEFASLPKPADQAFFQKRLGGRPEADLADAVRGDERRGDSSACRAEHEAAADQEDCERSPERSYHASTQTTTCVPDHSPSTVPLTRTSFLAMLVASMVMVALLGGPASAPGAGYWHSCRPPSSLPIGTLRAHQVGCSKARRIISGFYGKAQAEGPDVFVDGFHCVGIVGGTSCRRGAQRVRVADSSERFQQGSGATPVVLSAAECPGPTSLERPPYTRGAVPAAKASLGSDGRVLEVSRGPGSTYATTARRACGVKVLRDSVYVVVHPLGITCSACNLHAYVVKFREGTWKVWAAY